MKRKLLLTILTLTLALCSLFGLTACAGNKDESSHTHNFATLKYDAENHWFECECKEKTNIVAHNIKNGECICGYIVPHSHEYNTLKYDAENHWYECECKEKTNIVAHNIKNGECICGYVVPHSHEYNILKYDAENHWYECSCGAYETKENHKGGTATETSKAVCSECNQSYGTIIGHTHNYQATKTPPKCGEKGYTTYSCECGDSYISDYVSALTHVYTNYSYNNDAKCEVDGTKTASCDNGCGTKSTINATGTALRHSFTRYYSDKNATYEKDGTKTANCDNGCGEKDTIADVGSMLVENEIRFNTLSVNDADVYGKVSNSTTEFRFYEEIEVSGTATYVVDDDKSCSSPIHSKTVDLVAGDNTFYVLETVGNNVKLYTVTIHRREIFTVIFNAVGGTAVDKQVIEEDDFATEPTTTKIGYTFAGWDYDFATPITKNTTITASWIESSNTAYKVEYYLENLENDNYTLHTFENKTGTTNSTVYADIKTFEHFMPESTSVSGIVNANGTAVIKVYYQRNEYTITFDGNGGTLASGNATQTVKYGGSVTAPTFEKEGYTFVDFNKSVISVSENCTVTANWKVNKYSITIAYGNGEEDKIITQDYGTLITETLPTIIKVRLGYTFNGWDKEIPSKMPAENLTITANWLAIFNLNGGKITGLTTHGKTLTNIIIPNKIDNVDITSIGSDAFSYCTSLASIEIPSSVTSIGSDAFSYCTAEIIWGDNPTITEIGYGAFAYYKGTSIEIPSSVTSIGEYAFKNCSSLTKVNYLGTIDQWAQIEFGNFFANPTYYAKNLYINNELVTSAEITTATKISSYAFYNCSSLTSITIDNSVTKIGNYAFINCTALEEINFNATNCADLSYDNYVFAYAGQKGEGIKVTFGDNVKHIPAYLFCPYSSSFYAPKITSIEIPNSVTSIGYYAFCDCTALTEIKFNATNCADLSYGNYVFAYAGQNGEGITVTFGDNVKHIPANLFYPYGGSFYAPKITSIEIPNSVTSIGDNAFAYCTSLTSVTIGNSVTSIGDSAFSVCDSLTSIIVSEDNQNYKSIDGNLYTKDGTKLIQYAIGKTATEFVIPNSVTSIGDSAFSWCSSLTSLEIPNSVTGIGRWAFYNCSSLISINYNGTVDQWNAISKYSHISFGIKARYIQCIDGKVDI